MTQDKYELLRDVFGYPAFRPGQEALAEALLAGRDALGVMPTGAGKSVCYQLPALLLPGITLIISPLISLMRDQVNALIQMGVRGAYINSSLSERQCRKALDNACQGMYKIIYAAPERLFTPGFQRLTREVEVSMVCVDEAHCVSQWGQDFRPSYLKIPEFIASLPRRPSVGAFTATATKQVREDIVNLLELEDPEVVVTGFDRPNLYFGVERPKNRYQALREFLKDRPDRSGIVYCLARRTVEEVCDRLCSDGFSATRYHAGLEPEERQRNQDDFLYDRSRIMVATNAFGMGIDKSNVSFVVHYNMPKDLESYYQEAGRAGRDGSPADCVLLYSGRDVRVNQYLINQEEDKQDLDPETKAALRQRQEERLHRMTIYATTPECLRSNFLRYFGETPPRSCNHCSNCLYRSETVDLTEEARSACAFVGRNRSRVGLHLAAAALRGSRETRVVRLRLNADADYGSLEHLSLERTETLLRELIDRNYLARDGGEYPTLILGSEARDLLAGGDRVQVNLPKEKKPDRPAASEELPVDAELFRALKDLRMTLARKYGVPPFVIFTDTALREMSAQKPRDMQGFGRITGVGEVKSQRYGKAFLEVIAAYL